MLQLLYRSLLKYDATTNNLAGDLANCDISNYAEIKCFFQSGSTWNTGEPITEEDVLSTYSVLGETDANKGLQRLLSKMAISHENGAIVFRSSASSSEILPLLMVPIMKKDVTEKIRNAILKSDDARYSGPYRLEKRESDPAHMTEKITLARNENSDDTFGYSRIIVKFFADRDSLLSQANSINVIYPNRAIEKSPSSVFEQKTFFTPNFVGVFANSTRLPNGLRKVLLSLVQEAGTFNLSSDKAIVRNPFFTEDNVVATESGSTLAGELEKIGYFTKDRLIEMEVSDVQQKKAEALAPKKNTYFTEPSSLAEIVVAPTNEIVLKGHVPAGTESVSISGYKLKSFGAGDTSFQYRASRELSNFKLGTNVYTATFTKGTTVLASETLTIHMIADENERKAKEEELAPKPAPTSTGSEFQHSSELAALDANGYYKKDRTPFTVNLRSLSVTPEIANTAVDIVNGLQKHGIKVQLESIDADLEAISQSKKGETKNYDLLLTGVNLGYFGTYLFPHFHSGQAEDGLNFAKLRDIELDILLETLKTKNVTGEKRTKMESDIIRLLRNDAVIAPLYAMPSPYFIDKNVKNVKEARILPSSPALHSLIEDTYINENRIIDMQNKSAH